MMSPTTLLVILVIAVFASSSRACILQPDWTPWNLTRRTQRADIVVVGTVIDYYPIFRTDDVTPLFYSAQIDVSCVLGVNIDSGDIAKNLYANNGVVNVTGFNARLFDCVRTEMEANKEYIAMLVGDWNGGDMVPDQINAQPSVFNSTADTITELTDAMSENSHAGYQLKSRKCPVPGIIDIEELMTTNTKADGKKLPTTAIYGRLGATRLPAKGAEPTPKAGGNGRRSMIHELVIVLTITLSIWSWL